MSRASLRLFFTCSALVAAVACAPSGGETGEDDPQVLPSPTNGDSGVDAGPKPEGDAAPPDGGLTQDSGAPDSASAVDAGPACDLAASPLPACAVTDANGTFVSSSLGNDANDGSRAHPLKTLGAAITKAAAGQKRVFACAESYAESITLADGVSLFGSLTCSANWASTTKMATIMAPSSPAVAGKNLSKSLRIEGVDVRSPNSTVPGGSSMGVVLDHVTDIHFALGRIEAGDGAPGTAGTAAAGLILAGPDANPAIDPSTWLGGWTTTINTYACQRSDGADAGYVVNSGGVGRADGPRATWNGTRYVPTYPAGLDVDGRRVYLNAPWGDPAKNAGGAGYSIIFAQTSHARDGASGAPGTAGSNGGMGAFAANGTYTPSDGTQGGAGQVGLGGGGGMLVAPAASMNANEISLGRGADGGAGGCPGVAGTPGKGGGASVAIFATSSGVALVDMTLVAGHGGLGGSPGADAAPTNGRRGGLRNTASNLTEGGFGGSGGPAGPSGAGGTGPSFGIAYTGNLPSTTRVDTQVTHPSAAPVSPVANAPLGLAEAVHAL